MANYSRFQNGKWLAPSYKSQPFISSTCHSIQTLTKGKGKGREI
jgi:hypothetical protein